MFARTKIDLVQEVAQATNTLVKGDVAADVQKEAAGDAMILCIHLESVRVVPVADRDARFDDLLYITPVDHSYSVSKKQRGYTIIVDHDSGS